jgi:hypothetical protein
VTHTPGPWVFEPGPKDDPDVDDADFLIAEAREPAGEVIGTALGPLARGTSEGNARLLAIANTAPHECDVDDCPGRLLLKLLTAAAHALRSYQFGNSSADLAVRIAPQLEAIAATAMAQTVIATATAERIKR